MTSWEEDDTWIAIVSNLMSHGDNGGFARSIGDFIRQVRQEAYIEGLEKAYRLIYDAAVEKPIKYASVEEMLDSPNFFKVIGEEITKAKYKRGAKLFEKQLGGVMKKLAKEESDNTTHKNKHTHSQ